MSDLEKVLYGIGGLALAAGVLGNVVQWTDYMRLKQKYEKEKNINSFKTEVNSLLEDMQANSIYKAWFTPVYRLIERDYNKTIKSYETLD